MSYRIVYGPPGFQEKNHRPGKRRILWALVGVTVLGLLAAFIGQPGLWRTLLPGDPEITGAALDAMVERLGQGESVRDCITAFCQEIVYHAGLTP